MKKLVTIMVTLCLLVGVSGGTNDYVQAKEASEDYAVYRFVNRGGMIYETKFNKNFCCLSDSMWYIYHRSFFIACNFRGKYKKLSVPLIKQEKSNWCWVASAQMMGKYYNKKSTVSQSAGVKYVKGKVVNEGGTLKEAAKAANYYSGRTHVFIWMNEAFEYKNIKRNLGMGYALYAAAGYYKGSTRTGGHAVVVYGYSSNNGLYYNDPWDKKSYHCTYSAFCNGSFNGRKYDGSMH